MSRDGSLYWLKIRVLDKQPARRVGGIKRSEKRVVEFSRSVVSDSLRPHGLQRPRPSCPLPTPGVYSNSCPLSRWCQSGGRKTDKREKRGNEVGGKSPEQKMEKERGGESW